MMVVMDWPIVVTLGVCALAAVILAFIADNNDAQRRKDILASAPDRHGLEGLDMTYLQEEEIRTRGFTGDDVEDISSEKLSQAVQLSGGWASQDFINTALTKQAIHHAPFVLVIDQVSSLRLLHPVLEHIHTHQVPLVVVAREIDHDTLTTLGLNALSGRLRCLCVQTLELQPFAEAAGCEIASHHDLMAGYLAPSIKGSCQFWVCDAQHSWVGRN
jgi:hypothetical protein